MKIICSKSNLLKSVSISLKAVPSKTTMPILECILIDATTNQIKFTTNDMELGIETIVEGTIEEKGMVALNAKIFYEIIRRLPDNDVIGSAPAEAPRGASPSPPPSHARRRRRSHPAE